MGINKGLKGGYTTVTVLRIYATLRRWHRGLSAIAPR